MTISSTANSQTKTAAKGSLLVASTCIGGGMLAMPIQTAEMGFYLSALVLVATWGFMTFTCLLLVEATSWFQDRAHFSSMAQSLLGTNGKRLSLLVYLFMNCVSLVAYTSAGAALINQWAASFFSISLGYTISCILFTLIFGGIVTLGISFVGRINVWLFALMGFAYCCLIFIGMGCLKSDYLVFRSSCSWVAGLNAIPMVLTAFSCQMIIPSLCSYLDYDVKKMKRSIVFGTSIPFVIYFLWLLVIHGLVPLEGAMGLREAAAKGSLIVEPLKGQVQSSAFFFLIDVFAFMAVATSYIGLSVALFDFVRDFFKGISKQVSENAITVLSIVPALVLAILFPRALVDFLDLSGGFGDALLSGLIPIGMIWVGRYSRGLKGIYESPGGKLPLYLSGLFYLFIFIFQWIKLIFKI